jgi:hypothetical protein
MVSLGYFNFLNSRFPRFVKTVITLAIKGIQHCPYYVGIVISNMRNSAASTCKSFLHTPNTTQTPGILIA